MSRERHVPYVGISGVISAEQQSRYETMFDASRLAGLRNIMFGVKAVHSAQWCDSENKYGKNWYPVGAEAFQSALWPIHLCNDDEMGVAQMYIDPTYLTEHPTYPEKFVEQVMTRGQDWLTHIQFDMLPFHEENGRKWSGIVEQVTANGIGVILQCHGPAMRQGVNVAIEKLRGLPPVDYILFDASHGTGTWLDIEALLPFLEAAYNNEELAARGTNFGIAGGLEGQVVRQDVPRLVRHFPDISWDAEGRLHLPWQSQEPTRGLLNDEAVGEYLKASGDVLNA